VKENPAASLGDAFTKTALASDKGLNDKTNRHLQETCDKTAFVDLAELKVAVNAYIADSDCASASTSCDVDVKYGWPMNTRCVGAVSSFNGLFYQKSSSNEDISSWQTGLVSFVSCSTIYIYTAILSFTIGFLHSIFALRSRTCIICLIEPLPSIRTLGAGMLIV